MQKKKLLPGHAEGLRRDPRCEPLPKDLPLTAKVREKVGGFIDAVYDDLDDDGRRDIAGYLREHATFLEGGKGDSAA